MPCPLIPFPQELRPQLPTIVGNVDYRMLRRRLEQIDVLLHASGVERSFVVWGAVERPRQLGLKAPLDLEAYFLDSTCLKANIHVPTDWVLLRDRTFV